LVNKTAVWIHHIIKPAPFFPVAFIFNERAAAMVNRWYARVATASPVLERDGARCGRVNPPLN
jgi:hypothetical protein